MCFAFVSFVFSFFFLSLFFFFFSDFKDYAGLNTCLAIKILIYRRARKLDHVLFHRSIGCA